MTTTGHSEVKSFTLTNGEKKRLMEVLKNELSREDGIVLAFLYGSFLEERAFRDIDIGIFIKEGKPPSPTYELDLENRLSKALNVTFPIEIRVVNKAPITFLYHVITGKLLVCKDEEAFTDLVTTVARKYQDLQPILSHYTKEAYGETDK